MNTQRPSGRTAFVLLFLTAFLILLPQNVFNLAARQGDLVLHYTWSEQFARALHQGDLYPRWLPDEKLGLGDPTFVYYPPLYSALVAIVSFTGIGIWNSMKVVELCALWLAGVFAYRLLRRSLSMSWALAGAATLQASPFLMGLLCDFNARPWYLATPLFLAALFYAGDEEPRRVVDVRLALAFCLLVLAHVLTAFMALLCIPFLALGYRHEWKLRRRRFISRILRIGISLGLGDRSRRLLSAPRPAQPPRHQPAQLGGWTARLARLLCLSPDHLPILPDALVYVPVGGPRGGAADDRGPRPPRTAAPRNGPAAILRHRRPGMDLGRRAAPLDGAFLSPLEGPSLAPEDSVSLPLHLPADVRGHSRRLFMCRVRPCADTPTCGDYAGAGFAAADPRDNSARPDRPYAGLRAPADRAPGNSRSAGIPSRPCRPSMGRIHRQRRLPGGLPGPRRVVRGAETRLSRLFLANPHTQRCRSGTPRLRLPGVEAARRPRRPDRAVTPGQAASGLIPVRLRAGQHEVTLIWGVPAYAGLGFLGSMLALLLLTLASLPLRYRRTSESAGTWDTALSSTETAAE